MKIPITVALISFGSLIAVENLLAIFAANRSAFAPNKDAEQDITYYALLIIMSVV